MTQTISLRAPEVRTFAGLELRDVDHDGRWLEGTAVPYGEWANIGWFMEQHSRSSFSKSISEAADKLPLLLWHDNRTYPIGVSDHWTDAKEGLRGGWRLDSSEEAHRAADLASKGMLTGMSIGFAPIRSQWELVADDQWDPDLGPDHMDKVTRVESRLLEVSLTPTPAFAGAQVSLVRSREARKAKQQRNHAEVKAWRGYLESIRRG